MLEEITVCGSELKSVVDSLISNRPEVADLFSHFEGSTTFEELCEMMALRALRDRECAFAIFGPSSPAYYGFGECWLSVECSGGIHSITLPATLPGLLRPTGQAAAMERPQNSHELAACLHGLKIFESTLFNAWGIDGSNAPLPAPEELVRRMVRHTLNPNRKPTNKLGFAIEEREVLFGDLDAGTVGWVRIDGNMIFVARSRSRRMRCSAPGEALLRAGFGFARGGQ